MSARCRRGTISVISTRAMELCIRVLYHRLGCCFSDGVPDAGGVLQDGTRVRWLAHVACVR